MAWGGKRPEQGPPDDGTGTGKQRLAAPPPCARCELTKSQMNRTIQNYQKAYRRKVEGLKQELGTVRADNTHLRDQVRRLRRKRLLHAPSLLVGGAVGYFASRLAKALRERWQQRQQQQQQQQEGGGGGAAAAAAAAAQERQQQQQEPLANGGV